MPGLSIRIQGLAHVDDRAITGQAAFASIIQGSQCMRYNRDFASARAGARARYLVDCKAATEFALITLLSVNS